MHGIPVARECAKVGVWYSGVVLTLQTIAKDCERDIDSTRTGTGTRADPGEKRRDRRRGAAAAGTGRVGAADSFGLL